MGTRDVAEAFLAAVDTLDLDAAAPYCTDDFLYIGPLPEPASLERWRKMATRMKAGFPDWHFSPQIDSVEGDTVYVTVQVTGTNTGDLDLSPVGGPLIPATGRSIQLDESTGSVVVSGDRVSKFELDVTPGTAGIFAVVAQLGEDMG
jgi:predicted ester cyclase